jgi:hypothetical protein
MAHTYTPSDDAILSFEDAVRRIQQLERRVEKLEDYLRQHALNARAAELERTGAEDASEGSLFAQQRESEDRAI